jgi:hypothetical protein
MKEFHSKCFLETILNVDEISFEENTVFPEWMEELKNFSKEE